MARVRPIIKVVDAKKTMLSECGCCAKSASKVLSLGRIVGPHGNAQGTALCPACMARVHRITAACTCGFAGTANEKPSRRHDLSCPLRR